MQYSMHKMIPQIAIAKITWCVTFSGTHVCITVTLYCCVGQICGEVQTL